MKNLRLYNPTSEDFSIPYDTNGDGQPIVYILHAQEIESYEEPVAAHIKQHLAHKIAGTIKGKGTYEAAFDKAVKMIEVNE